MIRISAKKTFLEHGDSHQFRITSTCLANFSGSLGRHDGWLKKFGNDFSKSDGKCNSSCRSRWYVRFPKSPSIFSCEWPERSCLSSARATLCSATHSDNILTEVLFLIS